MFGSGDVEPGDGDGETPSPQLRPLSTFWRSSCEVASSSSRHFLFIPMLCGTNI